VFDLGRLHVLRAGYLNIKLDNGCLTLMNITLQGFSAWANGLAHLVFFLSLNKYIFLNDLISV